MNAIVNRQQFADALGMIAPAIPAKTNAEVQKYIKAEVTTESLLLSATDTEISAVYRFPGATREPSPGAVLLHPARVTAIVRESKGDEVSFSTGEYGSLRVECSTSHWELVVPDAADFPEIKPVTADSCLIIPALLLRDALRRTLFASDESNPRFAFSGVLFDIDGDSITLAATDSRRLAVSPVPSSGTKEPSTAVLPTRALKILMHALDGSDSHALLSLQQNDVIFQCGHLTLYFRQVQGRFPRYRDVIPRSFTTEVHLEAGRLGRAIRQSMAVMNEESRGVDFEFTPGKLNITASGEKATLADIRMDVESDAKLTICFDPKFVGDFLKQVDQESSVHLKIKDADSAALFTADDYQYVLMPLASGE